MDIRPQKITQDNSKSYGSVVTAPQRKPTSESPDYRFWSDLAHYSIGGETEIGICTVYRQKETIISGMERHIRTPEILIPIDAPFILPLMLDNREPSDIEAFHVAPGEAVVINRGIWHGACLPVGVEESSYFVIFRLNTPHEDVEKREIPQTRIIID